ncbi:MAG TPA: low affinity iron permease family protein, partial [Flavobacterium sp.]|nr:low affinity iron permease family protein [Flavobacterium sp.]
MKNMKNKKKALKKLHWFETFTSKAVKLTGSSGAFISACLLIVFWIVIGPLFHYSEVWRHSLHIGTTIVTFLMVFLLQKNNNKDALAIQIKLNEL